MLVVIDIVKWLMPIYMIPDVCFIFFFFLNSFFFIFLNMLVNTNPDVPNAVKYKRKYIYPEMLGRTYHSDSWEDGRD